MPGNQKKLWNMKEMVILIVNGALRTKPKDFVKRLEDLKVRGLAETIQTKALLRSTRILSRVQETCCQSNSSKRPSASTGVKNLQNNNNNNKYLDLARELKKLWNMKVTIVLIVIGAFGTITKGLLKRLGGLGSWRTSRDYLNDSIAENSQNPETNPGDLRRIAVTQTPVKNYQLILMWKTLKE